MKALKFAVPMLPLVAGLLFNSVASFATPAYAKKEGKSCTFCHVKMGSKELNAAGNFYKEHNHSLEGYKPA
jgi:hypothetical protein